MRTILPLAAALGLCLALGCDRRKAEEGAGTAEPQPVERKASDKPVPAPQTFYAAQQAAGAASPSSGGTDPGRVVFDGDKRTRADLSAPVVGVPADAGTQGKTVTYTASERTDSLLVGEPPAPGKPSAKSKSRGSSKTQLFAKNDPSRAGVKGKTGSGGPQVQGGSEASEGVPPRDPVCGPDMATLPDFCIDRWEASTVDKRSGAPLSPYYAPDPNPKYPGAIAQQARWAAKPSSKGYQLPELPAVEKSGLFEPMAVSKPGVYPQGFANRASAERACRNAGKRLCTRAEWYQACAGPQGPKPAGGSFPPAFPYGSSYEKGRCNFNMVPGHPLMIVGRSSSELDDPRLMLAESGGRRLLAKTGEYSGCANAYGVYDMVGNQDEVVADTVGDHMVFVGSFYSRGQSQAMGCASSISAHHASMYYDYSIGFRCCKDR